MLSHLKYTCNIPTCHEYVCMYVCMYVCIYVSMYVCMCFIYACMYVFKRVCIYVCVYSCMYVCQYVSLKLSSQFALLWKSMHLLAFFDNFIECAQPFKERFEIWIREGKHGCTNNVPCIWFLIKFWNVNFNCSYSKKLQIMLHLVIISSLLSICPSGFNKSMIDIIPRLN